jgi:hypothetical protein
MSDTLRSISSRFLPAGQKSGRNRALQHLLSTGMQRIAMNIRHIIASFIGGIEALLLARLVLRLLAARPDHPVLGALFAATTPPAPLAFLDSGQPRFGATLELSTLALILLLLLVGLAIVGVGALRRPTSER